jgi:archaellum component FlaC
MELDVTKDLEQGLSLEKLNAIEERLGGVENTLQELIDNADTNAEEVRSSLSEMKTEMEKNTSQVKRLQRKLLARQTSSKYLFCVIIVALVLWSLIMNSFKVASL